MGRHDAYSYHSEAGRADGTPGKKHDSIPEGNLDECPVCEEEKPFVVERSGDFKGEEMCSDCLSQKRAEKEEDEASSVLDAIRNGDNNE